MIQFSENIYGRFLHHQCNYLFAYQSVCCFVLLLLLKFNQTELQITKYYVGYKQGVQQPGILRGIWFASGKTWKTQGIFLPLCENFLNGLLFELLP